MYKNLIIVGTSVDINEYKNLIRQVEKGNYLIIHDPNHHKGEEVNEAIRKQKNNINADTQIHILAKGNIFGGEHCLSLHTKNYDTFKGKMQDSSHIEVSPTAQFINMLDKEVKAPLNIHLWTDHIDQINIAPLYMANQVVLKQGSVLMMHERNARSIPTIFHIVKEHKESFATTLLEHLHLFIGQPSLLLAFNNNSVLTKKLDCDLSLSLLAPEAEIRYRKDELQKFLQENNIEVLNYKAQDEISDKQKYEFGFSQVLYNAHHQPEKLLEFINTNRFKSLKDIYTISPKTAKRIDDFFTHNLSLHAAVQSKNTELVRFLVFNLGVDIDGQDISGRTPLYLACEKSAGDRGSSEMIKFLLELGANPNIPKKFGLVPLCHLATKNDELSLELIDIMVNKYGADPYIKTAGVNYCPLYIAGAYDNDSALSIMSKNLDTTTDTYKSELLWGGVADYLNGCKDYLNKEPKQEDIIKTIDTFLDPLMHRLANHTCENLNPKRYNSIINFLGDYISSYKVLKDTNKRMAEKQEEVKCMKQELADVDEELQSALQELSNLESQEASTKFRDSVSSSEDKDKGYTGRE
jgi:ankyrin repeat protein